MPTAALGIICLDADAFAARPPADTARLHHADVALSRGAEQTQPDSPKVSKVLDAGQSAAALGREQLGRREGVSVAACAACNQDAAVG